MKSRTDAESDTRIENEGLGDEADEVFGDG